MRFPHADIRRFLIESIPTKFQHLTPAEFEDFIGFLFTKDGYEVDAIPRKGDLHTQLLAKKDGNTLVIKALKFPADYPVPVKEVHQAAAARTYYDAEQAWILTTSFFEDDVKEVADEMDIELWDWDTLHTALSDLFFDGKDPMEFADQYEAVPHKESTEIPLSLKVKWQPEEGVTSAWYNLELIVSNLTSDNHYVHLDLPALIDTNKNQIMAEKWSDHEFVAGMIYAGASIRTNALFKASRLGERPVGGHIILTCHERDDVPVTYHLKAKIKGSACYLVTYCFTRHSEEYRIMTSFRDNVLTRSWPGRLFIETYYTLSPLLILLAKQSGFIRMITYKLTILTVRLIQSRYLKTGTIR